MGAAAAGPLTPWLDALGRLHEVGFAAPQRLWFGLPLALVLLLAPLLARPSARRAAGPLLLRAGALAALLAVLCGPRVIDHPVTEGRVLVLADVSPSVGEEGRARERAVLEGVRGPYDLAAFGAAPGPVREAARPPLGDGALEADPRGATDVAAALRLAAARRSRGEPLRVLLLSDGRSTAPGDEEAAAWLRRGAELWAHAVPGAPPPRPPDLRIDAPAAPPREERVGPFPVTARVTAEAAALATVTLYVDAEPVATREVDLVPGANDVVFDGVALPRGLYDLQVLVEADRTPRDNLAGTRLEVPGTPRVLLLAAEPRRVLLAEALQVQGLAAEVAPAGAEIDLDGVDAVVLLPDAPREALEAKAADLADFVARRGGGLLAIGGAAGPGLARLAGSPVAFLLPLEVPARKPPPPPPPAPEPEPKDKPRIEITEEKREAFPITLCLVIDRSGSMLGPKLRQAQLSALAAARTLGPEDRIALVAFADTADTLLAPRPAGDAAAIVAALRGLSAEGHTAMFAALEKAHDLMGADGNPIRHVVLISDGRPTDRGPWRDLVDAMAKEKITVSSVGIGMDVDSHLLGRLAHWGSGRYWLAQAHEIPQVVTQDTLRVMEARDRRGKDAERAPPDTEPERPEVEPEPPAPPLPPVEAEPPPAVPLVAEAGAPREMLKGLDDASLPKVAAFEEGEPRFASWVAARAGPDGPPLLTYGRVGLGTAAALAVDPEAPPSKALREYEDFPRLMAQLVRSVLPDARAESVALDIEQPDDDTLVLRVTGEDGRPRTDLALDAECGGARLETVRRADRYEARLPPRAAPATVRVRFGPSGGAGGQRAFLVAASASAELSRTGADRAALLRLVGDPERLDADPARALAVPRRTTPRPRGLELPFLLIAAILLPLDAWARRRARSASP